MKKIVLLLAFSLYLISCFAQEKKNDHILYKDIPLNFKINDKIVVQNASPYMIQQIVIALPTQDGFTPLGSLSNIEPTEDEDIDMNNEALMNSLRGKTIAIKVKGLKYLMKTIDDASEAVKNNDDLVAIYGFDVSLSAHKNDLIIKVFYKSEQGESIMDF